MREHVVLALDREANRTSIGFRVADRLEWVERSGVNGKR
jgi:hypothetical protein